MTTAMRELHLKDHQGSLMESRSSGSSAVSRLHGAEQADNGEPSGLCRNYAFDK